jgi:hypothetical protein
MSRRRRWLKRIGIASAVLLTAAVADYHLYPRWSSVEGPQLDRGENGAWIRYTWYFGERKPDEIPALADRLKRHGIRDAYFHVRYIKRDGSLRFRYPVQAQTLNGRMAQLAPTVRRIAWIYAGNSEGEGDVVLSDPKVRQRMVGEAVWLVEKAGFQGVQWDYEICPDRDPHLLKLLEETRAALPPGTPLGVAVPTWMPPPISGFGWSEGYFGEVARRCDQIAVMGYDTGLYFPRAYSWLMAQNTARVTRAVAAANPQCRVLMGVPTYEEGPFSHNSHAENLRMALQGVREGLALKTADASVFAGIALFADYTTDEAEWAELRRSWTN